MQYTSLFITDVNSKECSLACAGCMSSQSGVVLITFASNEMKHSQGASKIK